MDWLRSQPDQQDLVRACFFDDPVIDAARRYYQSPEWNEVRRFLPPGKGKALDLGAGRGISSYALATDGWETSALEPDPSELVGAGAIRSLMIGTGVSIHVVEQWGESLPFDDATFDLVYARQALHHARDLRQLCAEIGRVLKSGGTFIATREHVISKPDDLEAFLAKHPLHYLYGGESAYTTSEYRNAIEEGGIRLIQVLNPLESDINLHPETRSSIKAIAARRLHFPFPTLIPGFLLDFAGSLMNTPGRLYTFVGRKP